MRDDESEDDLQPDVRGHVTPRGMPLLNHMFHKVGDNHTRIVIRMTQPKQKFDPKWANAMQQHLDEPVKASDEEIIMAAFQKLPDEALVESARVESDLLDAAVERASMFLREATELALGEEMSSPPPPSSYLAELLVPEAKATDFVANMEELLWDRWVAKYGFRRAWWLWYAQIGHLALGHWVGVAVDLAKSLPALIKFG